MKKFLSNEQLINKLEKKAGIKFSKTTLELFNKKGYIRIKEVIIYMKQNNIKMKNRFINSIYKNEKHLRHMLMPRIESFEVILKNYTLHEIKKLLPSEKIFDDNTSIRIFLKDSINKEYISLINNYLRKVKNNLNFNIMDNDSDIYEWFHKLTFGLVLKIFNELMPKYKKLILKKAFNIKKINLACLTRELDIIRLLRNKIAHAEQIFNPKNQRVKTNKKTENDYILALSDEIKKSNFKILDKYISKFIDRYISIKNKYIK